MYTNHRGAADGWWAAQEVRWLPRPAPAAAEPRLVARGGGWPWALGPLELLHNQTPLRSPFHISQADPLAWPLLFHPRSPSLSAVARSPRMPPPTSTNVDPASGARCQADADADVADEARRVSAPQPQRCARAGRRLVGRCSGLTHHLSLPTSAACTALHCTHSLLVDEHHLLSSSSGSRCTVGGLHLLSEMSAWRASLPGYRAVSQRLNAWVTRKPHRSEHVLQAMIGVNVSTADRHLAFNSSTLYCHPVPSSGPLGRLTHVHTLSLSPSLPLSLSPSLPLCPLLVQMIAGIVLLTQVQRWRLGSFDEQIADLSTAKPQLWEQYERGRRPLHLHLT